MSDEMNPVVGEVPDQGEAEELRAELAGLRAELVEARVEAASYRPFVFVPIYDSPEAVIAHVGLANMREGAMQEMAGEARARHLKGLPPLWDDDDIEQRIAARVEAAAVQMVKEANGSLLPDDPLEIKRMRTMKMVKPDGMMWQLPLTGTINNASGSINDPVERYKKRGHKLAVPVRCWLRDCWAGRAEDQGRPLYGGFCSAFHQQVMEGSVRTRADGSKVAYV